MALEFLGGAFLSSLFQNLSDKISSSVINFFRRKKLDEGLLNNLKIQLRLADKVIYDAETKQLGNRLVREWLHELKQAAYEAEDLMIDISDESQRCEMEEGESSSRPRKVMKLASSLFSTNAFVTEIESKIEEILDRLKFLLYQASALGLEKVIQNRPPSHSQRSLATSMVEESGVFGRDAEKGKIVELLMSSYDCDKISVIPIVGMGGIGKTTLAGLVYNDDQVQKHFDVKAWVTVLDDLSVARVTKTILDRVDTSQACDIGDLDLLQVSLKEVLRGKRFFFVLDDVWNEDYGKWHDLRRAFESGAKGSKIIVTTRDRKIASMMADANISPYQLKTISDKDCLKLFMKHAINSSVSLDSNSNLEMICRIVVERCKGLPLAVQSLAGLLRSEPNLVEWEKILKSNLWELSYEKVEIPPALWLSYHYLPSHLKRCFTYCAIFPHDYGFGKQEIILLWVAENLLPRQKGKMLEEVGEEYFNDLVSRSIFQKSRYYRGKQELFTMHDLVNDLAKLVFGKFCTIVEDIDSDTSTSHIVRHLSFRIENICGPKILEALSQAKSLRTFLTLSTRFEYTRRVKLSMYESLPHNLLFTVLSLRVLSLSEYPSRKLPNSIGDLKHLRYLNLSFSKLKSLPDTMCNLYNLQILLLSWCYDLTQLPTKIGSLTSLRHLDVTETLLKDMPEDLGNLKNLQILLLSSCRNLTQLPTKIGSLINLRHLDVTKTPLKDMPKDLGNLKNLQFLSDFVVVGEENGWSNIQQLGKLHHLHGKLRISGLQNAGDVGNISGSILEDKYLDELFLEWNLGSNNLEKEGVLLDRLRPQATLKRLKIKKYGGERFSEWLGDISFSNIATMSLKYCNNCSSLPSLGQLPSLQELGIYGFAKLEKIGEEFFGNGSTPFRSLKTLSFMVMRRWKEWSFSRATGVGGVFPCLTRLVIFNCNQLVRLVSGAPQHKTHTPFPSLQHIQIVACPRLESFLESGSFSKLKSIFICECEKLLELRMQWDLQRLTSLTSLHLSGCQFDAVDLFPEEGGSEDDAVDCDDDAVDLFPEEGGSEDDAVNCDDDADRFVSRGGGSEVDDDAIYSFPEERGSKDDVVDCEDDAIYSFPEEGLLPTTLTSLKISSFGNLQALNGKGLRQLTSLESLEIFNCEDIQCLPEEGLPNSLSFLGIEGVGSLLGKRCQRETGEDWHKIAHISHVIIDRRKI